MEIRKKRFGWLAGLVLVPVVEGQVIIRDPQNATVCVWESAEFTSETDDGFTGWRINGTGLQDLPSKIKEQIIVHDLNTVNGTTIETLIINYHETFNGLKVQSIVLEFVAQVSTQPSPTFSTKPTRKIQSPT